MLHTTGRQCRGDLILVCGVFLYAYSTWKNVSMSVPKTIRFGFDSESYL